MIRVHVFCEGQTEDVFVCELLAPHFRRRGIWLNSIIVLTGPQGRGGVSSYAKLKRQIVRKCREDGGAHVTTFLDFYGLPGDFPALAAPGSSYQRALQAEAAWQRDIGERNFLAHLVVHEFEALLFSCPEAFGAWFDDPKVVKELAAVRHTYPSPEHIDDGRATAPSKRILSLCAGYDKVLHGSLIALDMGLDVIRRECPLFDGWIRRLEALAPGGEI